MKKLKIIIIIFVFAIVMIIGGMILLNKGHTEMPEEIVETEEIAHAIETEEEEPSDQVKDSESFFTANSCVSQYMDFLNKNNDIYYGYDDHNNYTQVENPSETILEVLSEKYIKQKNISKDNLQDHIQLFEDKVVFIPLKMRLIENSEIQKYLVYGMIENLDDQYLGDIYLFVNLDGLNATFSIEPIEKEYSSISEIEYTNEETAIEPNDFNEYVPVEIDDEFMCQQYFSLYKNIALAKPEKAYEFLNKEYREKRFGDVSGYIKYLKDNQDEFRTLQLSQYLVNGYEEYTEYVCKDQYENLYIFNETALMEFGMKLDTYTIPTDNFTKTYKSANEQKKVMMNVDQWVQMLNTRDYTAAYKLLNETFRNNNFNSEEKFVTYMKEHYPLHYKIEYTSFSQEGTAYVQHIKLKDIASEETATKELDIIMKLEDDLNFVMSFSIE